MLLVMHSPAKTMSSLFVASFIILLKPPSAYAERISIQFDKGNQTMSADIQQARLSSVIEHIRMKKRMWLKGEHYLTDKDITVEFKDLPVEKGIKRILSTVNHSLVFDQDGRILGLIIVSSPDSKWSRSSRVSGRGYKGTRYRRR